MPEVAQEKKFPPCPRKIGDVFDLKIKDIIIDKGANPRRTFDRENLNAMAATIKQVGVLNPLSIYWGIDGKYHLIAGERRYKASQIAGLTSVPTRLFNNDDTTIAEARLAENLHHEQLNPLEEALAIKPLIGMPVSIQVRRKNKDTGKMDAVTETVPMTGKMVAERYKKSQAWVSQRLALLEMPQQIQTALMRGKLDFTYARELISLNNAEQQMQLFTKLMKGEGTTQDIKDAADKAKGSRAQKRNTSNGSSTASAPTEGNDRPNIQRQSLDTALDRLKNTTINTRGKNEVREGIATGYENFSRAKSNDKKAYFKGAVAALEWIAGLRERI